MKLLELRPPITGPGNKKYLVGDPVPVAKVTLVLYDRLKIKLPELLKLR